MTEVTILFLDGTFSSTAVGPMEVFRHAGTLWNYLTEKRQVPRFHVTTASVDGRAVRCDGPIHIQPDVAITAIRRTDGLGAELADAKYLRDHSLRARQRQ